MNMGFKIGACLLASLFFADQVVPQGLTGDRISRITRLLTADAMVATIAGTRVELIKDKSVDIEIIGPGQASHTVEPGLQRGEMLSARNPTLVYNHDYGSYGYITGEIIFKFRDQESAEDFPEGEFNGFRRVGSLNIFSVQATSPEAFMTYLTALKRRKDLIWVDPISVYVASIKSESSTR
jgi:hypothetical protein